MNRDFVWEWGVPVLIGVGFLLSISTNLRMRGFPIGPGELLLAGLAAVGYLNKKSWGFLFRPIAFFWVFSLLGFGLGALLVLRKGALADHHAMAYLYTATVTVGISALVMQLSDVAIRRSIFCLSIFTAISLWLGFFVYLIGGASVTKDIGIVEFAGIRYSGWSENPNQLALFFVPLPVWVAALWRDLVNPNRRLQLWFGLLLFALMLMGLLVRSDGLFVVWVFEFLILLLLRMRWELKVNRALLVLYALIMALSIFLVKTFAHGDVRSTVLCTVETLYQDQGGWAEKCFDRNAFRAHEAFRIGYNEPVEKTGVRKELWMHGFKAWIESPWVGNGPGEYSWNAIGSEGARSEPLESHNITIDLLTQGGLLAGVAWIALVSYLLINAWRIRDSYTFSVVLMMAAFTFFHNTRQPYLWFVLAMSDEAIRRKLFVSHASDKA